MTTGTLRARTALRNFSRPKSAERCELCALPLAQKHQHLIDPATRSLTCTCDGCAVLFDDRGVTKLRRVPRDVRKLSELAIPNDRWERLLVPINLAFFYRSSHAGRVVAIYPSAAGMTESLIEDESWEGIARANPSLGELREDIEALLVNRLKEERSYFIAPIDRCFEVVGIVRTHWRGFSGGDQVWRELESFFSKLKEEARA